MSKYMKPKAINRYALIEIAEAVESWVIDDRSWFWDSEGYEDIDDDDADEFIDAVQARVKEILAELTK